MLPLHQYIHIRTRVFDGLLSVMTQRSETIRSGMPDPFTHKVVISFRVNVSLSAAQSCAPRHADPSSHLTLRSQLKQYFVLPYVTLSVFPGFPGALTPSRVAIAREASSLRRYVM
jgi:hypothetical protein